MFVLFDSLPNGWSQPAGVSTWLRNEWIEYVISPLDVVGSPIRKPARRPPALAIPQPDAVIVVEYNISLWDGIGRGILGARWETAGRPRSAMRNQGAAGARA